MRQFRYVNLFSLMFNVAIICVVSYAILENVKISISGYSSIQRPLLYIAAFCHFPLIGSIIKKLKRKEYFPLFLFLLLFLVTFSYSTLTNRTNGGYAAINFFIYIVELFLLMVYAAENDKVQLVFNLIFKYALFITIITDIIIFTGIIHFTDGSFETYLIGSKFSVAYLHIYLLAFFLLKHSFKQSLNMRQVLSFILLSLLTIYISIRVDCNTGLIGSLLLMFFIMIFRTNNRTLRVFTSPLLFIGFIFASSVIAFLFEIIIQTPIITNFITNTLGRDLTLTGRTEIYSVFASSMSGHWLWGYGFGNAYTASMSLFGYANAQNALLQWILQIGLVPVIFLVIFWAYIMFQVSKKKNLSQIMPAIALIYVFIILGTVEITYSMNFILWISLLLMWAHRKEKFKEYI